jgi:hypothetical protein
MAWSTTNNTRNNVHYREELSISLPNATGTGYSSVIDFLDYVVNGHNRGYIEFVATVSTVSGTNIDIALYGSYTETGTKYLLADAIVADFTTGGAATKAGSVALYQYPFPYYFIAHTVDANESANNISYYITSGESAG